MAAITGRCLGRKMSENIFFLGYASFHGEKHFVDRHESVKGFGG